jgi:hypothetical protein
MTKVEEVFVPGSGERPLWRGSAEALEGWNVFWATLREGSLHSTLEVGDAPGSDPLEVERVFRGRVVSLLQNWLERNPQEAESEAFRVLVATAPWKPNSRRIGFYARPTPEGCELIPQVELVQRVLREVFGIGGLPAPTEEAVYVVDLLQPPSAGRYQLFGPATSREDDRTRVLRGILEALLRRTSADFPIEVGHRLRVRSLSNGKVIVSFPPPGEQVGSEVLEALPDLWSTAVQDLRNRLSV